MRISPIFVWYDLWIGFFWDSKRKWLYFFPLPTLGLIFKFSRDEVSPEAVTKMVQSLFPEIANNPAKLKSFTDLVLNKEFIKDK